MAENYATIKITFKFFGILIHINPPPFCLYYGFGAFYIIV